MIVYGIDLGTTSISGAAYDTDNNTVLKSETVENDSFITSGNEYERIQDVNFIIYKARRVLDSLIEEFPQGSRIGLTGQMHGILYLDREGQALGPLYTWQDRRGDLPLYGEESVVEHFAAPEYMLASGYGLVTHIYNLRQGLIPEGAVSFCTIADYLGMKLTGRDTPLLHQSNAASLGFWSVERAGFDLIRLREAGVEPDMLPVITARVEALGSYRDRPVMTAIGDNQASYLGATGQEGCGLLLNMGTGGQISVRADQPYRIKDIETRPYLQNDYLLVGASLSGGRAYAALERFFRSYVREAVGDAKSQYPVMEGLIKRIMDKDNEGIAPKVSTTFNGTRNDPSQRGSILGLTEDNLLPEYFIYGFLKGMADELFEMYRKIKERTPVRADMIIASGNGLRRNEALRKICSEVFGLGLVMSEVEEEAAAGAAKSCLLSLGEAEPSAV